MNNPEEYNELSWLNYQGYKFCNNVGDLTLFQEVFIVKASQDLHKKLNDIKI